MERYFGGPESFFGQLLWICAPEKKEHIVSMLDKMGSISFYTDNAEDRILFKATPSGKITVGLRSLVRLWADCFSYFTIVTELRTALAQDPSRRDFDPTSTPRFRTAKEVVEWAANNDIQIELPETDGLNPYLANYPEDLPRPFSASDSRSDGGAADNICLMALGFILHHELAHIRLHHIGFCTETEEASHLQKENLTAGPSASDSAQESDADRLAAEWLLDGVDPNSDAFSYKAIGTAAGLIWLASHNVHLQGGGSGTRPPDYDRLYVVLDRYLHDPSTKFYRMIWEFVVVVLTLHLRARDDFEAGSLPPEPKAAARRAIDVVAKLLTGG